jgi:hypothetical protein
VDDLCFSKTDSDRCLPNLSIAPSCVLGVNWPDNIQQMQDTIDKKIGIT